MDRDTILTLEGPAIPEALRALPKPPAALYVNGTLPDPERPHVAIVGSRLPSDSGEHAAYTIARDLARAGVVVVSGLARGVDCAAHRGAMEGGGATVAFLGHGADRVYPRGAVGLARQVIAHGALVSEYAPGTEPRPWRFVDRNRLIAASTRGTLVVEAGARSGALITAGIAAELGRDVWAVPGDPRRPTCRGSNRLLRDGVGCVLDATDILAALGLGVRAATQDDPVAAPPGLDAAGAAIWAELVRNGPLDADGLARGTGLQPGPLLETLSMLELRGIVRRAAHGFVVGEAP